MATKNVAEGRTVKEPWRNCRTAGFCQRQRAREEGGCQIEGKGEGRERRWPLRSDISNTPSRKVDCAAIRVTLRTLYILPLFSPLPPSSRSLSRSILHLIARCFHPLRKPERTRRGKRATRRERESR